MFLFSAVHGSGATYSSHVQAASACVPDQPHDDDRYKFQPEPPTTDESTTHGVQSPKMLEYLLLCSKRGIYSAAVVSSDLCARLGSENADHSRFKHGPWVQDGVLSVHQHEAGDACLDRGESRLQQRLWHCIQWLTRRSQEPWEAVAPRT